MTYDKDRYPDALLDAVRHAWTTDRRAMAVIDAVRDHDRHRCSCAVVTMDGLTEPTLDNRSIQCREHGKGTEWEATKKWPPGTILERDGVRWRIKGWKWSENVGRPLPQMVAEVVLMRGTTGHGLEGIIPEEDILSGFWNVESPRGS